MLSLSHIRCPKKRTLKCDAPVKREKRLVETRNFPRSGLWWEKLDLNQRSFAVTDLQSAPIDQTLAFSRMWRALKESSPGRADPQSAALPTELRTRGVRGRLFRTGDLQGHTLTIHIPPYP